MVVLRVAVRPGDQLFQDRRFHDYKVAETKFAGPTMFSRGDTTHNNQHGTLVARERSTAIRYLSEKPTSAACTKTSSEAQAVDQPELDEVDKVRRDWLVSNRVGVSPRFEEVRVGDTCPVVSSARTASRASPPSTAPSCSTSGEHSNGIAPPESRTPG